MITVKKFIDPPGNLRRLYFYQNKFYVGSMIFKTEEEAVQFLNSFKEGTINVEVQK